MTYKEIFAILSEEKFYRGLTKPYDENYSSHIEWYSPTPEIANQYAGYDHGANVIVKDISDEIKDRAFEHGFRTAFTEIKADDFVDRIKRGIRQAFSNLWISKDDGLELFNRIKDLDLPSGYKRVFDWWNETPEFVEILKDAGYLSIKNIEQGEETYGVFK